MRSAFVRAGFAKELSEKDGKEILVVSRRIRKEVRAMKRLYNDTNGEIISLLAPPKTAHTRKEVGG